MELTDSILSLVFPHECAVCGGGVEKHADGDACASCWAATPIFTGDEMLCEKCGAYFGARAAPVAVRCHRCDDHHYDRAFAAGIYEQALSASILKIKTIPSISRVLRNIIRQAVSLRAMPSVDLIIPVPLSKLRRVERGFNQAELVADELSKILGVGVDRHSLTRRYHTPIHRVGMDQKARELTVENAFEVLRPHLVNGRSILLVDDVLTSGATASNCAKVLKKHGSGSVYVFTLARAVMH